MLNPEFPIKRFDSKEDNFIILKVIYRLLTGYRSAS